MSVTDGRHYEMKMKNAAAARRRKPKLRFGGGDGEILPDGSFRPVNFDGSTAHVPEMLLTPAQIKAKMHEHIEMALAYIARGAVKASGRQRLAFFQLGEKIALERELFNAHTSNSDRGDPDNAPEGP